VESKAKILGHPIHQMLVPFPLGLLGGAFVFDVLGKVFEWRGVAGAAFYMIAAGIVAGLLAAVFGLIDFLGIPSGTRAKRVGTIHGIGNVIVVALFALSWFLRREAPADPSLMALTFSAAGFALSGVTGWLGGELVDRLSVGVDDGAHLDAPNSLTHSRAATPR
jgi:uncharacterized membrane protein